MKTSQKGIDLIKEFEGCQLKAYQDANGVWTIGWGIVTADKDVTGKTIQKGMTISQKTADEWFEKALTKRYEPKVRKYDSKYHWNQNEFDAMVSFAYNIGSIDALTDEGKRSKSTIAEKILLYNKAGGRTLAGLTRRRRAEHDLFITPVKKKPYSGKYPAMPKRGYYKYGDGIVSLVSYRPQIIRVQQALNWAFDINLKEDGKYGKKTVEVVEDLQRKSGLPVNGCYGSKCQAVIKKMKK